MYDTYTQYVVLLTESSTYISIVPRKSQYLWKCIWRHNSNYLSYKPCSVVNQATSPSTMTRRDDKIRKSQTILRQVNFFQKLTNPFVSNNRKFKMKNSSFLNIPQSFFRKDWLVVYQPSLFLASRPQVERQRLVWSMK